MVGDKMRKVHKKNEKADEQQENKQKVVSVRDKCRFGSNVHNFIVLKHG